MRTVATRVLASILVGVLSTSCGAVRESRQAGSPETGEIILLPRAPRAVASPVVEELELRRALEEFLQEVDVEATRAELRRLVADPRFHGRRAGELRVVLASWGSGPAALEEITRGYRAWCAHAGRSDCLTRTLNDSDVYEFAFDFAMGAHWDGFVGELKTTIDPATIRLVLLTGLVIFMATIAFPELTSKIPAAVATMALTAYLGARAVCDLIFGWIQMVGELDDATSFDQVREAGQRYGLKVGTQTARILILLATAAIAKGGVIARLMKLPGANQASAALATETGGVGLQVAGQVKEVRVLQSGVAITVQGAVGVAMAAQGPAPGAAPSHPKRVLILDENGRPCGEFDEIQPGRLVEDKSAKGLNVLNPKTGRPQQSAREWARTQIHDPITRRLDNLHTRARKTAPSPNEPPNVPSLNEVRRIREYLVRVEDGSPEIRAAVNEQLAELSKHFPGWKFHAAFGPH